MARKSSDPKLNGAVLGHIEEGLERFQDGRVIVTIERSRVVQVEFLEKEWDRDVWGIQGGGI